jgi:hypothetical protein
MTNILALGAAAIIAFLGLMHLGYTLHDVIRTPKFFRPLDTILLSSMRNTKTALAPNGADYWSGVLGFHLSHCIGVLMFALMISVAALYSIVWMQSVLIVVGFSYVTISYKCWFHIPTICIGLATVLMVVGWLT